MYVYIYVYIYIHIYIIPLEVRVPSTWTAMPLVLPVCLSPFPWLQKALLRLCAYVGLCVCVFTHVLECVCVYVCACVSIANPVAPDAGHRTKSAPVKSLRFSELFLGIFLSEFRFTVFFPLGSGDHSWIPPLQFCQNAKGKAPKEA